MYAPTLKIPDHKVGHHDQLLTFNPEINIVQLEVDFGNNLLYYFYIEEVSQQSRSLTEKLVTITNI